ncbi:hypothetical protein [Streptomyces mirabilis]|uniref:hypothetical protein n=1 Tax=Streptomyces mirabilis TaxID=68239 RepID=UPI0033FA12C3
MQGQGGQPEAYCHRAMLDAIGYLVDNGIKWQVIENRDRAVSFRRWGEVGPTAVDCVPVRAFRAGVSGFCDRVRRG